MKKSHLVTVSIIGIFTVGILGMLYYQQVYTQNRKNEGGSMTGVLECSMTWPFCEKGFIPHGDKCVRKTNGNDSDISWSVDNVNRKECTIFGFPNAGCFVNAYKSCTPAIIQQKMDTIEGDPVFYTAIVTSANSENKCSLELLVDTTNDRFAIPGISKSICQSVESEDGFLRFTNCEDNEEHGFPLR